MRTRKLIGAFAALALASSLAACSNAAADDQIVADGTLDIGIQIKYPPMEYFPEGSNVAEGFDVELIQAVAGELGVTANLIDSSWDTLIPGAKSGRYDVVISAIGDFTDRQEQIDMVDYLSVRSGVIVQKGDAEKYPDAMSLCGATIGATKGSVAVGIAEGYSADCVAAGESELTISQFDSGATGVVALKSGRVDAQILDGPAAIYQANTVDGGESFALVLDSEGPEAIYAIGVSKSTPELRDAVRDAVQALIDNGTYAELLEKYGLSAFAIDEATINAGGDKQ